MSGDYDLQILAGHDHRGITRAVEPFDELQQVALERCLCAGFERRKSLEHWSVIRLEDLQPVRGRPVAENEVASHRFDRSGLTLKKLSNPCLCAPQRGRLGAR